jgi:sugar-specific transcriptional regulator TrmB
MTKRKTKKKDYKELATMLFEAVEAAYNELPRKMKPEESESAGYLKLAMAEVWRSGRELIVAVRMSEGMSRAEAEDMALHYDYMPDDKHTRCPKCCPR